MRRLLSSLRQALLPRGPGGELVSAFEVAPDEARHLAKSEMGKMFFAHKGRTIHKWVHYLDLYDRHFSAFRNKPVRFLEIGVWKGGSLQLWEKYFGPQATIIGIDINPLCEAENIRVGSQADPVFLRSVVAGMGGVDVVLDDGSHVAEHQRTSFETLFPLLSEGGLYVIEDLHTAYWPEFQGGFRRKGTAIELVKGLIDDMHGWWHDKPSPYKESIGGIHVYDSVAFIEKARREQPKVVKVGGD